MQKMVIPMDKSPSQKEVSGKGGKAPSTPGTARRLPEFLKNRYVRLYLAAFLFFYLVWALLNYSTAPDTRMYFTMGKGIFRQFTFGYAGEGGRWYPNAFRVPLFPFIIGFIQLFTGDIDFTCFLFVLLQILLIPVLPCLGYYFGSQLDRKTAWGAYLLLLFNPNLIVCSLTVLSDVLFAVFSGLTFLALWKALERKKDGRFFTLGLFAGGSCMVRPIMKLYYLCVGLLSLAFFDRWKSILKRFGLFLAGFVIVISPWLIRNTFLYGRPLFETNQGLNLLWTNGPLVRIKESDPPEVRELKEKIIDYGDSRMNIVYYRGWQYFLEHDFEISKKLQKIALEAYLENPGRVLWNWRKNYLYMSSGMVHHWVLYNRVLSRPFYWKMRGSGVISPGDLDRKWYHLYLETNRVLIFCYKYLALAGILLLLWRHRKLGVFIGVHLFYFTGLTAFVAGYDRYRLNLEIFHTVLIAYPLVFLAGLIRRSVKNQIQGRKEKI